MGGISFGSKSDILLIRISALPHEAVHARMSTGMVDGEKLWLDEGLAEYFGVVMFNRFQAIKNSEVFILDEPASYLDKLSSEQLLSYL